MGAKATSTAVPSHAWVGAVDSTADASTDASSNTAARRALRQLMNDHGDELFSFCMSMVGDRALAEDVHQTVFMQAFRDLSRFRGDASGRTWLYSIARHRCIDALRSRRRWMRRFEHRERIPDGPSTAPGPDRAMEMSDDAKALHHALSKLSPKARLAVTLRYQHDMSFAEMAEVCGDPAGTLQARVARALPVLRRHLDRQRGRR